MTKLLNLTHATYFGLIDWSPPGVPGGGMTGVGSSEWSGIRLIWGSTSAGGVITPPDRAKSELVLPLNCGAMSGADRLPRVPWDRRRKRR
jgi:hypothetical protein